MPRCYVIGTLLVVLLYKGCCGIKWNDIRNMFEKVMKKIKLCALRGDTHYASTHSNSSSILKKQECRLLNLGIFWGNFLLAYSCVQMLYMHALSFVSATTDMQN